MSNFSHLRERVIELINKAETVSATAERLGVRDLALSSPSPDDEVATYDSFLRETLSEASAHIPELPSVPHDLLVHKALQRRPPFAGRGTGYRDALIWETVKEILRTSDESVTFVTANTSDFGSSDVGIPQGLLDELTTDGVSVDQLRIVSSSGEAAAATLGHAKRLIDRFEEKLEADKSFREYLFQGLSRRADLSLVGGPLYSSGHWAMFRKIHKLHEVSYFQPIRSWLISQGRIGVEFEVEADADVDIEYEDDSYPYHFDPESDSSWSGGSLRSDTTTVTASLTGQLEFDEASEEVDAVEMSLYRLSEPALLRKTCQ